MYSHVICIKGQKYPTVHSFSKYLGQESKQEENLHICPVDTRKEKRNLHCLLINNFPFSQKICLFSCYQILNSKSKHMQKDKTLLLFFLDLLLYVNHNLLKKLIMAIFA